MKLEASPNLHPKLNKEKIFSIQILRAVSAFLVLFLHLKFPLREIFQKPVVNDIFESTIGSVGVDIFFIISGFVISLSLSRRASSAKFFFQARMTRVIPLYFILTIPYLLKNFASNQIEYRQIFNSFFFLPVLDTTNFTNPLHPYGWTLSYEIFFYLVMSVLLVKFSARKSIYLLSAFFLVSLPISLLLNAFNWFGVNWFFPRFFFSPMCAEFAMGIIAHQLYESGLINKIFFARFLVSCSVLVIAISSYAHSSIMYYSVVLSDTEVAFHRVLLWGLPSCLLLLGCVIWEASSNTKHLERFSYFGDISYSLYLVQPFAFLISEQFDFILSRFNPFLAGAAIFFFTLLIAVASYELLEKKIFRVVKSFKNAPV